MVLTRKKTALVGKILVEAGRITEEQLREALLLQKNKYPDKSLGAILVSLGIITEEQIYTALTLQYAYPYISVSRYKFQESVLELIPKEVAMKYNLVPLDKFKDILTIAMLNPLDRGAIEKIEEITGLKVRIFVTPPKELQDALELVYKNK